MSNVLVVQLDTGIQWPLIGSVDLGYDFSAAAPVAPPKLQLNVNALSAILIKSPSSIPCLSMVIVTIPVEGTYAAVVGVSVKVVVLGYVLVGVA